MGTACCGRVAGVGVEGVSLFWGHCVLRGEGKGWEEEGVLVAERDAIGYVV